MLGSSGVGLGTVESPQIAASPEQADVLRNAWQND